MDKCCSLLRLNKAIERPQAEINQKEIHSKLQCAKKAELNKDLQNILPNLTLNLYALRV